ncbi:MAG: hypothetical protein AAFQ04_02225 [Pseudomonadota bacterium]
MEKIIPMQTNVILTSLSFATAMATLPGTEAKEQNSRANFSEAETAQIEGRSKRDQKSNRKAKPFGTKHKAIFKPDLLPEDPSYSDDGFARICVRNIGFAPSKPTRVALMVGTNTRRINWPSIAAGEIFCRGAYITSKYKNLIDFGVWIDTTQSELDLSNNVNMYELINVAPGKLGFKN